MPRILLVGTSEDVFVMCKNHLDDQPEIHVVQTGKEALAELGQYFFDLAIVCQHTRDINGVELTASIRIINTYLPIIILSRYRLKKHGANTLLVHPIKGYRLLAAIRGFIT